jgi:hypothetical protein
MEDERAQAALANQRDDFVGPEPGSGSKFQQNLRLVLQDAGDKLFEPEPQTTVPPSRELDSLTPPDVPPEDRLEPLCESAIVDAHVAFVVYANDRLSKLWCRSSPRAVRPRLVVHHAWLHEDLRPPLRRSAGRTLRAAPTSCRQSATMIAPPPSRPRLDQRLHRRPVGNEAGFAMQIVRRAQMMKVI